MITAGIDIGSRTAKAVVIENNQIISWSLINTGSDSVDAANRAFEEAIAKCGRFSRRDVKYVVATGYGRVNAPFADCTITEITCHTKGASWFFPSVRTILDMGGQDCKAIRCENAKVVNFVLNEKCAAGTGRYLEKTAATLGVSLQEMGELSLRIVEKVASVSSYCAIFAQNDMLALMSQGTHRNDILAGACQAIAERMLTMLSRLGRMEREFCISGGIAKNVGVVSRLETALGFKCLIPPEPQIVGAMGAAIFASEKKGISDTR